LEIGRTVAVIRGNIMWKRELIKNKLYSAALIFTLIMGLPLFFAKENWIM
jgi:hypothetical protein